MMNDNPVLILMLPQFDELRRTGTYWWLVDGGQLATQGSGDEWLDHVRDGEGRAVPVIGLAPAALARLIVTARPDGHSEAQVLALARANALADAAATPDTLHAVAAAVEDDVAIAYAANEQMLQWLDWAAQRDISLAHIVPVTALVPRGDDWVSASFGDERLIGRGRQVLPDEPDLAKLFVGDAKVQFLEEQETAGLLVAATRGPWPLDLRSGRFARREPMFAAGQERTLAWLVGILALLAVLPTIVTIVKYHVDTGRLDDDTLAIARPIAGPAVTIETAEAEVAARLGSAAGGTVEPMVALLAELRDRPAIAATQLGTRGLATLDVTLSAASPDIINQLLIALQQKGYHVTAVPRQSADGRTMVDMTVRGGA